MSDWPEHYYRIGADEYKSESTPEDLKEHRSKIEPWLSAVLQSEHLSLLNGTGLTTAISHIANVEPPSMETVEFGCELEEKVNAYAKKTAENAERGEANIEDQIRAALALITGLEILGEKQAQNWKAALKKVFTQFLQTICKAELRIAESIENNSDQGIAAINTLVSFVLSFASRTTSRERLNIFTTNYDRLIEFGCDKAGVRVIDRFVGALSPIFRSSRMDIDYHYNPPGIRGEPRFLEGVVKLTKLHGSIDWVYSESAIKHYGIPFGKLEELKSLLAEPLDSLVIYPNPAKDVETLEYPYAELFRDCAAALCRDNSSLVTYGYGFGDDHINRIIRDMLTISSTHLVIISYDDASGRIPKFCQRVGKDAQISILLGSHFGDLGTLVSNYLPKPSIDHITWRKADLLRRRGDDLNKSSNEIVKGEF